MLFNQCLKDYISIKLNEQLRLYFKYIWGPTCFLNSNASYHLGQILEFIIIYYLTHSKHSPGMRCIMVTDQVQQCLLLKQQLVDRS